MAVHEVRSNQISPDQNEKLPTPDVANTLGLTETEAARRLQQYGENALAEHHVSVLERLAHFFWGPIPWMIEIAALLSGLLATLGRPVDHSRHAVHQRGRRVLAGV